jgi:hypothetical protein
MTIEMLRRICARESAFSLAIAERDLLRDAIRGILKHDTYHARTSVEHADALGYAIDYARETLAMFDKPIGSR